MEHNSNLVSTDWLAEHLDDQNLVVVDASWYLPGDGPDPKAFFRETHIPGTRFFDIEDICDQTCSLPHMVPPADEFAEKVGSLGISNDDLVVVYDTGGVRPAARVWWLFKVFGHSKVAVLDGGLGKWLAEGKPTTAEQTPITPKTYTARLNPEMVAGREEVLKVVEDKSCTLLDARGPGRFSGAEAEPRPGMRGGHIPGAKNVYYGRLFNADGTFKSDPELKTIFAEKGVTKDCQIITSCGSGVTASILALALDRLGHNNVKLYDGSWAEWGMRQDTPIETGLDD